MMNLHLNLTMPSVHLNGTGLEEQRRQVNEARMAVTDAHRALCCACPSPRDYYPQGPDAYERARAEHDARVMRLVGVMVELDAIAEHLADEADRRDARRSTRASG